MCTQEGPAAVSVLRVVRAPDGNSCTKKEEKTAILPNFWLAVHESFMTYQTSSTPFTLVTYAITSHGSCLTTQKKIGRTYASNARAHKYLTGAVIAPLSASFSVPPSCTHTHEWQNPDIPEMNI